MAVKGVVTALVTLYHFGDFRYFLRCGVQFCSCCFRFVGVESGEQHVSVGHENGISRVALQSGFLYAPFPLAECEPAVVAAGAGHIAIIAFRSIAVETEACGQLRQTFWHTPRMHREHEAEGFVFRQYEPAVSAGKRAHVYQAVVAERGCKPLGYVAAVACGGKIEYQQCTVISVAPNP